MSKRLISLQKVPAAGRDFFYLRYWTSHEIMDIVPAETTRKKKIILKSMVYFLLYYAVIYMGHAVYNTFIPVYFDSIGSTPLQIGSLLSLGPLVAILAQPIWGAIGDRANTKNSVLKVLIIGSGISILLFPVSNQFYYLLLIICVFSFFQTSIFALSDAITLDELDKQKKWSFGPIRMGGTLGFALMSVVFGMVASVHIHLLFPVYALVMVASLILLTRLPKVAGYQLTGQNMQVWVLFKNRKLMLYMGISFALQVTLGYYYAFFPVYFKEMGGNNELLGWSMVISSLSEIPFLLYSHKIFQRVHIRYIFIGAGVATFFRWIAFYYVHDPYFALPVQLLHGLMFIVMNVTMATYINREVPKELKASGQALNGLLSFGASRVIGSFIGGLAVNWIGMRKVFLYHAFIALLCIAVFGVISAKWEKGETRHMNGNA
jgi:PPP family 3-phenylpropionic acid transporter